MDNFDFSIQLFIGRVTRRSILLELTKAIVNRKGIKNFQAACSLMNEMIDSERASAYLWKHPDRIVIP